MSDLNISNMNMSELLSSLSGTETNRNHGYDPVLALFGNNNKSTEDSLLGNVSLSDYASIKNGSYYNLMKRYYAADTEVSKTDLETYKKTQEISADKAATLCSGINDLMDTAFTEENKDTVIKNIKTFVNNYNDMLDNALNSDSRSVAQKGSWLKNMTDEFSSVLGKAGITIATDGKLSVDEESLKKADMTSLQNTFGTNVTGFSNKVLYKAEQIYSLAKTYGSSATAYTSSGTYQRNYTTGPNFTTQT